MAVEVNFKDLRAAVVDLNKSGLIKKQVVLVGVAKEKIYEDFMAAMDKIEDDPETKEFPKGAEIALAYFNNIFHINCTILNIINRYVPSPHMNRRSQSRNKCIAVFG